MPQAEKKAWVGPKLIVIVRGRQEEAVLTGCKNLDVLTSPYETGGKCNETSLAECYPCDAVPLSKTAPPRRHLRVRSLGGPGGTTPPVRRPAGLLQG